MKERSLFACFKDGVVAEMRSMSICDRYEGLLVGTRSAQSRRDVERISERVSSIEESALAGQASGEYVVIPELVPEKWGLQYVGDCIKEYSITTRFQADGNGDCLELEVIWDASREEFTDFWKSLDTVTRGIDFKKYCRHIDWDDLG